MSDHWPGWLPRWAASAAGAGAVLAALALFVAFGLLGVGWDGRLGEIDSGHFYVAGLVWGAGGDPYDAEQYSKVADATFAGNERYRVTWIIWTPYFFPPTTSAPAVAMAALPVDAARLALVAVNVAAAAVLAGYVALAARRMGAPPPVPALAFALAIGSSATAANVWMGQAALLATAALCLAWACRDAGLPTWAGVFAALATVKPQVSALAILALLLGRDWRTAAALVATSVLLAAPAMAAEGPLGTAEGWLGALRQYRATHPAGLDHGFGLQELAADLGVEAPWTAALALLGFAWAWRRRDAMDSPELLGVLLALPVLFVQARGYDVVATVPLLSAALASAWRSRSIRATAGVLVVAAASAVPGRALRMVSDWPPAMRSRELLLLALLAAMVVAVERRASAGRRPRPAD